MNYYFLTIIILLGVITSYEDFKFGKIRNLWIGLALLSGLFLYGVGYFVGRIPGVYLGQIFLNTIIAVFAGFFLWRAQAWSAGDAKLFTAYVFLLPFKFYAKTFLPVFPAFAIILNAFLLVLFYLLIKAIYFLIGKIIFDRRDEKECDLFKIPPAEIKKYLWKLGKILPPFFLFMTLLAFIYIGLLQKFSINLLSFQVGAIIVFVLLADSITRFYQNKYSHRLSFLLFIILVFYGLQKNFTEMKTFLINLSWGAGLFIVVFPFLHRLIEYYLEEVHGHEIPISELCRGMILKKGSITSLGLPSASAYSFIGMSHEQIIQVQNLAKEKKLEKITVGRPFYFAFWIFMGVLATISLSGSFLRFLG